MEVYPGEFYKKVMNFLTAYIKENSIRLFYINRSKEKQFTTLLTSIFLTCDIFANLLFNRLEFQDKRTLCQNSIN